MQIAGNKMQMSSCQLLLALFHSTAHCINFSVHENPSSPGLNDGESWLFLTLFLTFRSIWAPQMLPFFVELFRLFIDFSCVYFCLYEAFELVQQCMQITLGPRQVMVIGFDYELSVFLIFSLHMTFGNIHI